MKSAIALLVFWIMASSAPAKDYVSGYVQSQGGSIRYYDTQQQPQNQINIVINNNQAPAGFNGPIDPVWIPLYYNQYFDSWRYGSPSDIRKYIFRRRYYRPWRK